jgi:hypothetical protein
MRLEKRLLIFTVSVYAVFFLGVFAFYLVNPFQNKCISGNCVNGYGIYLYQSGMQYEGEWKNGRRHGKGTLTYPEIYTYTGEWKNNKEDGYGGIVHNLYTYVGEWKRGSKNGKGSITYKNGIQFNGDFKDGYKHGQGTMTYPDGRILKGEWNNEVLQDREP